MRFALLSATREVPSFVLHFPRHWDERDRQHGLLFDLRPMLSEEVKLLIAQRTMTGSELLGALLGVACWMLFRSLSRKYLAAAAVSLL